MTQDHVSRTRVEADARPGLSESAAHISIRGLSKSYDGKSLAVDGLNLDIAKGEFIVLLGPSGCGKTTTMRSIVGLEEPDAGSISIDGDVLFDRARGINVPPNKRRMGMVFQSYALWPHKTVFQNIAYPLRRSRVSRSETRERVNAMLATVGLEGFGERQVGELSGGQMQRAALARGVVGNPRILLLDEPLSNLDAQLRSRLRMELKELQQRLSVTTVYVTHDQEEALGLADRVLVMRAGKVEQQDEPVSIYANPVNGFVARFMGIENRVNGTVTAVAGAVVEIQPDGEPDLRVRAVDQQSSTFVVGDHAELWARPEDVHVQTESAGADDLEQNVFVDSTMISHQFQGSFVRYHVKVGSRTTLVSSSPARQPVLAEGDSCVVSVRANAFVPFPLPGGVG